MSIAVKNTSALKVIVIGGGPSGMMAAISAAKAGAEVLLLERNHRCGEKLLITGGGRCNITNNETDDRKLLLKYKDAKEFLFSAFAQFNVRDTIDFFAALGLEFKEEAGGRMFPATESARSVLEALLHAMEAEHIKIRNDARVTELLTDGHTVTGAVLEDGTTISGDRFIIATGGTSRPETGSSGDGFIWLKSLGHTIHAPNPSLVPVRTLERWTHALLGFAHPEAKVSLLRDGKVATKRTGRILFTHFGLSGPLILNMSKEIWMMQKEDPIIIEIDLFPKLDEGALDREFQSKLAPSQNRMLKNALSEILEPRLAEAVIGKLKLDPAMKVHQLKKEDRKRVVNLLKHIRLTPTGLLGADKAIVTSGGLPLKEVDTRSMRSDRYANLYVTGDVLDIDRPSGGYSLQLCWTTGHVAGTAAAT